MTAINLGIDTKTKIIKRENKDITRPLTRANARVI